MAKSPNFSPHRLASWSSQRTSAIWANMMTNNLWQRMLKNTLATTVTIILATNPSVVAVYGKAAYLAPITTVFGHPGRRFGMMAEALVLAVCGTMLGIAWSIFGLYLSSLVYDHNSAAAYTIKGLFLAVALLFHGFLRSNTPRLFIMVLLLVIVSVVSLTGTAVMVSKLGVTQILYPILTAVAILLAVNTCVFPEFSSRFLGNTTIETLNLTTNTLRDAGKYFLQSIEHPTEEVYTKEQEEEDKKSTPTDSDDAKSEHIQTPSAHSFFRPWTWYKSRHRTKPINSKNAKSPPLPPPLVKLKSLTDAKAKLRSKLTSCKAVQQECNFELAFAVLPPRDLKVISVTKMQKLVANTVALIGACESKYALLGDQNITPQVSKTTVVKEEQDSSEDDSIPSPGATSAEDSSDDPDENLSIKPRKRQRKREPLELEKENLELVKPIKEIESGDAELLEYLLKRIAQPLRELQANIDRSVEVINSCLAYAYDVPKLPGGTKTPAGIRIEELDIRVDIMQQGLDEFDRSSASALESAAVIHDSQLDLMPRMETFLISSFILNQRSAAKHTLEMLQHSRGLVEKRLERRGRRRLYAPRIKWRRWLTSGGEQDEQALPSNARKEIRTGKQNERKDDEDLPGVPKKNISSKTKDEEAGSTPTSHDPPNTANLNQPMSNADGNISIDSLSNPRNYAAGGKVSRTLWLRNKVADVIEYVYGSEDVAYAFKLTTAVFLVTWPAFVGNWNTWYSLNRGLWAALQLVLITEVAIGTSVMTFTIRAAGTTVGCLWGWAAFEASNNNRPALIVLLVMGIIPSTYVQLGSKYIKAGMVSIISMAVVALATVDEVVPGTATENFLKRLLAFLIGGVVALLVELILYPVKARTRLVESLAAAIRMIEQMEACLAYGVDADKNLDLSSPVVRLRFDEARSKAEGSLTAAETFLPFCANEPRLKGSFAGLALVYGEILYVLHQIVEKMDNMLQLRGEYGSSALEELHGEIHPYRRNVAGAILLILFAVHEALTTKLPLPQFMPSARLAHLRMVNRVRSLLVSNHEDTIPGDMDMILAKRIARLKFVAFQAFSAGQIEVIEYLEELQELTKLLVGANEFRSGLLMRPTYREYVERIKRDPVPPALESFAKANDKNIDTEPALVPKMQVPQSDQEEEDEIRDVFSETVAAPVGGVRRRSTFKRDGLEKVKTRDRETEEKEKERAKEAEEDELPRSLQRVRSRRLEERNAELVRIASRREEEEAWVAGRDGAEKRK